MRASDADAPAASPAVPTSPGDPPPPSLDYLASVLLTGFESGELDAGSALFPALARLLRFGPGEVERVLEAARRRGGGGGSGSGGGRGGWW